MHNVVRKRKRENALVCGYARKRDRGHFENNGLMSRSRMIDGRVVLYVLCILYSIHYNSLLESQ